MKNSRYVYRMKKGNKDGYSLQMPGYTEWFSAAKHGLKKAKKYAEVTRDLILILAGAQ